MTRIDPDKLRLTDFVDVETLQVIQDSFAAVANVSATITDSDGNVLTGSVDGDAAPRSLVRRGGQESPAKRDSAMADEPPPRSGGEEYVAPIIVNDQQVGTIRMSANGAPDGFDETQLKSLSKKLNIDLELVRASAEKLTGPRQACSSAIPFLFLLANAIARVCYREFQLRRRVRELTAVYNVTTMLADARDLNKVLQRTAEVVTEVMEAKAASIRLIDREKDELVIKAVHNLSREYLNKGPIRLSSAQVDGAALAEKGYEYIRNMATDPRALYPAEARREGIVSTLSVAMRYKGEAIGVLRIYTDQEKTFSPFEIDLLKAIAAQAAAAIENTRLHAEAIEAEAIERQIEMARDVQQRMIPQNPPVIPGIDLASVYVPCFQLGGDLYDVIQLPDDNHGLVVADVSGKGVPASLIMASVRAALRAQVDNVFYLYEVMRRINVMLCRDSRASEFVTLFYGVIDARNRRLTYCNAGHPPGLVLRGGEVIQLKAMNMVLGVNPDELYTQDVFQFEPNDLLLLYTDGLPDAMNPQEEMFGRDRIVEVYKRGGATAEIVAQNLLWEMRKFAGLTHRSDDVTVVVAKVGDGAGAE